MEDFINLSMKKTKTLPNPAVSVATSVLIIVAYLLALTYFWLNTSKLDSAITFYTEVLEAKKVPNRIEIRNRDDEQIYSGETINNCITIEHQYACALFTNNTKWLNSVDIVEVTIDGVDIDGFTIHQHQHSTVISFDDFSIVLPKTTRKDTVIELAKMIDK